MENKFSLLNDIIDSKLNYNNLENLEEMDYVGTTNDVLTLLEKHFEQFKTVYKFKDIHEEKFYNIAFYSIVISLGRFEYSSFSNGHLEREDIDFENLYHVFDILEYFMPAFKDFELYYEHNIDESEVKYDFKDLYFINKKNRFEKVHCETLIDTAIDVFNNKLSSCMKVLKLYFMLNTNKEDFYKIYDNTTEEVDDLLKYAWIQNS